MVFSYRVLVIRQFGGTVLGSATFLSKRQLGLEHFALSAYFHLPRPAYLHAALANRPVDEPAKMPNLKFPCWAISLRLYGTLPYHITRSTILAGEFLHGQKKEDLTFNVNGDVPPPLFKTLNGFK
jgi:hypothetical protein